MLVWRMSTLEDIIDKILSARPELTREEVLRAINEREKRAKGFLTRESAALSLAADLGIAIESGFRYDMRIRDLVSGLNNVTVAGRVIYVSALKRLRRDGEKEIVNRAVHIADGTGVARVTLWGDKAISFNPEDFINRIVRFYHLSTRRKSGGRIELSAGLKSRIEINPEGVRDEDYPSLTSFTKKICELKLNKGKIIDVLGVVERVYPITTFKRQDRGEGRVRRVEVADGTGKAILVLWDEFADLILDDHVGKNVILFKVRVKERFDGSIELHTKDRTEIVIVKEGAADLK